MSSVFSQIMNVPLFEEGDLPHESIQMATEVGAVVVNEANPHEVKLVSVPNSDFTQSLVLSSLGLKAHGQEPSFFDLLSIGLANKGLPLNAIETIDEDDIDTDGTVNTVIEDISTRMTSTGLAVICIAEGSQPGNISVHSDEDRGRIMYQSDFPLNGSDLVVVRNHLAVPGRQLPAATVSFERPEEAVGSLLLVHTGPFAHPSLMVNA